MKIAIIGAGYVGLSLATLFSEHHEVVLVDVLKEKVDQINRRISPINDEVITQYFHSKTLDLVATLDLKSAVNQADFVVIATPTNYDESKNHFDTTSIDFVVSATLKINRKAYIVIKSTIPVGYIEQIRKKFNTDQIFFSPEFLREGRALLDNLYPTRIIVGDHSVGAQQFAALLVEGSLDKSVPVVLTNPSEAEAIKLFANTYLALRVSFFNELDTYAELRGLDTKAIIDGVSLDPRIGSDYNNPSFGYGGYCLPKDTKQLLANFQDVPNNLIRAVVEANQTRKSHIVHMISNKKPKLVGIYRLVVKKGSENLKYSTMHEITDMLIQQGMQVVVYEPLLDNDTCPYPLIDQLDVFKSKVDLIIANRLDENLRDVQDKVYSRDLYHEN